MWVKKSEINCFVSSTYLEFVLLIHGILIVDCSRHMTCDKNILVDYKPLSEGLVTFGDDVTARVLGRGTRNIDGFPRFKNVLHVDGLKANLIGTSQICDLNLNVNFNRGKFVVLDIDAKCVLKDFSLPGNC